MKNQADGADASARRAARYRADLDSASKRIEQIDERIEEIEREKAALGEEHGRLSIKVEILGPICEEQEAEAANHYDGWKADWEEFAKTAGIQDCCLRLLQEEGKALDAGGIRNRLQELGVDLGRYKNALAVIHTSLKRIPERVRSFRQKEQAYNSSAKVWVRYYEAIAPGAETLSSK